MISETNLTSHVVIFQKGLAILTNRLSRDKSKLTYILWFIERKFS